MQNKDKGDGIEDSPLDMLLVILLEGASKEVVMPSSKVHKRRSKLRGCSWFTKLCIWQSWTWFQSFFSKENQEVL